MTEYFNGWTQMKKGHTNVIAALCAALISAGCGPLSLDMDNLERYPANFAIAQYPGSTVQVNGTGDSPVGAIAKMAGKSAFGAEVDMVSLTSKDSGDVVTKWYKSEFTKKGWTLETGEGAESLASEEPDSGPNVRIVSAKKGSKQGQAIVSSADGETQIQVAIISASAPDQTSTKK